MKRIEVAVFLIAVSLHGGGLLAARSLPKLHHLQKVLSPTMTLEFVSTDIELPQVERREEPEPEPEAKDEPRPPDDETQDENRAGSATTEARANTRRGPRGSQGPSSGGDGPSSGDPGPGPQMTSGDGDGDWSAPGSDTEPSIPGVSGPPGVSDLTRRIAVNGAKAPPAETKAPKAKKADRRVADKVIKEELQRKDKALGLDLPAAGTIASIIKSAVLGSDAPADSAATFQVMLGPGGKVTSVTAGASRGGSKATWDAIAAMVKGTLKAQKFTLTDDYAKGAIIVVNVVSKMKMPSGAEVGAGLKLSLTQNFDVADIGAKPVRVVVAPFTATPVQ